MLVSAIDLSGCSSPARRVDDIAASAGYTRRVVVGSYFEHVVYESALGAGSTPELHIYFEGDGTPWVAGNYPSVDPTARRPIALQMMMEDPAPALYLGRPCYLGLAATAHCAPAVWTSGRYSAEVVDSLLSVINRYREAYNVKALVLIGYSGGGTLAALLARDIQPPVFLLTVGANLNVALWTEMRGFLPLAGSLDPIDYLESTAHIPQLHLAGLQDKIVPVAVTESYGAGMDSRLFRYYPEFDHSCCWLQLWPEILAEKPWAVP